MKKVLLIFVICFMIMPVFVKAKTFSSGYQVADVITANNSECDSIFGDPNNHESTAYWLQFGLNVMKYVAIAALLGFSTADFFKALVENDKDAMKKAASKTVKRFIYCVLIFFLPYIVSILMDLVGAYGTCGVS